MKRYIIKSNYGGAYDIDPEQYFTRDDIVEFAYEVIDKLSSKYSSTFDISDLEMSDPKHLYIEVENDDCMADYTLSIDMRTIRKPSDLMKYVNRAVTGLSRTIDDVYNQYE